MRICAPISPKASSGSNFSKRRATTGNIAQTRQQDVEQTAGPCSSLPASRCDRPVAEENRDVSLTPENAQSIHGARAARLSLARLCRRCKTIMAGSSADVSTGLKSDDARDSSSVNPIVSSLGPSRDKTSFTAWKSFSNLGDAPDTPRIGNQRRGTGIFPADRTAHRPNRTANGRATALSL